VTSPPGERFLQPPREVERGEAAMRQIELGALDLDRGDRGRLATAAGRQDQRRQKQRQKGRERAKHLTAAF
jgi:hypothetical protein